MARPQREREIIMALIDGAVAVHGVASGVVASSRLADAVSRLRTSPPASRPRRGGEPRTISGGSRRERELRTGHRPANDNALDDEVAAATGTRGGGRTTASGTPHEVRPAGADRPHNAHHTSTRGSTRHDHQVGMARSQADQQAAAERAAAALARAQARRMGGRVNEVLNRVRNLPSAAIETLRNIPGKWARLDEVARMLQAERRGYNLNAALLGESRVPSQFTNEQRRVLEEALTDLADLLDHHIHLIGR
ncbi:hypothetical protein [Lentzea guizhouensis]|uniref:hypothetical protein n=1 Tax=Lentzea guizhouensis TaxID=1586287 RepID=UPI0012B69A08|nr:hypothetical protein [Lentzea guizhouensis]